MLDPKYESYTSVYTEALAITNLKRHLRERKNLVEEEEKGGFEVFYKKKENHPLYPYEVE